LFNLTGCKNSFFLNIILIFEKKIFSSPAFSEMIIFADVF